MSSDHPSPTDAPAPPGRHVLVADDEPLIREALRRTLEKRGHRVTCAPDAPTAIELLKGEAFDAVLADARMPGDGRSILDYLDAESFQGVQVLMTGDAAAQRDAIAPGVHLLEKPFRFAVVIPIVEGADS